MKKYLLILISIVFVLFIFFLIANFYNNTIAFDIFISVCIFSLISFGLKYQTRFIEFNKKQFIKFFVNHFFAGTFISVTWISLSYFSLQKIASSKEFYYEQTIYVRFIVGLLLYFLVTAFNYLFIYYDNYKEQIKREAQLKNLITEAELKSLKFQINPHFIFNCLNSISALTTVNSEQAKEMTINLADFLRYTLSKNIHQTNKFSEELENVKKYLAIEKIRFENKFIFEEEIEKIVLDIKVPNMILQPLIENAIKYGVYDSLHKIKILLKAKIESNYLNILIENDCENSSSLQKGEGVGLENIKERLKLIYNRNDLISIKKMNSKFKVNLFIPI